MILFAISVGISFGILWESLSFHPFGIAMLLESDAVESFTPLTFDYNTRVVVVGTSLLGFAGGAIGVLLLLRKRALIGDAIAHATLPGLALAFFVATALQLDGKSLWILLPGAAITGLIGAMTVVAIRTFSPIKEDAAMGIVLSVFFGAGIAMMRIIQQMPDGYAAGLEGFIFGKTASMRFQDAWLIAVSGATIIGLLILFRRQVELMCFDESLARTQGWPVTFVDIGLMAATTTIVIVGLQAVGMILIIAMLVIPAAAARFWTWRFWPTIATSSFIGCIGAASGAIISTMAPRVPSGAAIVIVLVILFSFSALFGRKNGTVWRWARRYQQRRETDQQHLLRSIYEWLELKGSKPHDFGQTRSESFLLNDLEFVRNWSPSRLTRTANRFQRDGLLLQLSQNRWALTATGIQQCVRAIRQHRLLELYFAQIANLSPEAIDRGADYSEHALNDQMLAELERDIAGASIGYAVPDSLHPIGNIQSLNNQSRNEANP
jgi:manganese/zinc/iron transport system permease protein